MRNQPQPLTLAMICQIRAITELATGPRSDLERPELAELDRALINALDAVESKIGWIDTFGGPDHGRVA